MTQAGRMYREIGKLMPKGMGLLLKLSEGLFRVGMSGTKVDHG